MCLTCRARARSVVEMKAVRTQHGRSAGRDESGRRSGAAFGGAVADPSRSHHDVATGFSDLQFIFREGCKEKGRVTRARSGKDGEIPSARGSPTNFLRDETRKGRGDGARRLGPADGKSGRSEGE